jgi:hypothetical protein
MSEYAISVSGFKSKLSDNFWWKSPISNFRNISEMLYGTRVFVCLLRYVNHDPLSTNMGEILTLVTASCINFQHL